MASSPRKSGFGTEPNLTIENSYLRNQQNVNVPIVGSVNGCWMDNKLVVINNTRFDAPPGRSLSRHRHGPGRRERILPVPEQTE